MKTETESKPDAPAVGSPEGLAEASCFWVLFEHMSQNHGLTLLDSELSDICNTVDQMRVECECSKPPRKLWADELQMDNMKLRLELLAVKSKLAEVVSIARQGKYSAMDFVAVGRRLDAMDDYLSNSVISKP